MKRLGIITVLVLAAEMICAQAQWNYVRELKFPASDTAFVQPYFCTVTSTGRLYVLSTTLTNASAHNAIYYADSNATALTRMVDLYVTGDSDTLLGNIGSLRGIASLGGDILVNANVPYPRSKPNTVGTMYYYPGGDTSKVQKFGFYFNSAGHGTYHHGVAITKDTIVFTGIGFATTVRAYNFKYGPVPSGTARGSYIPPAQYGEEPGGPNTAGFDVIRDVAVGPMVDYNDSTKLWFSSRNSYSSTQLTGGIAAWSGGTEYNPGGYKGQRVQDAFGYLGLGTSVSYGITVDKNGYLWVAGNDSTRRWVKAFDVSAGIFASEVYELPSKNSASNPNPSGAPMTNPVDVALAPNGLTAYVPDAGQRVVYVFKFGTVGVADRHVLPTEFTLDQNFPNPFNPTTMIAFTLPKSSHVRLAVSNALGQEVAVLADGFMEAGKHVKTFVGEGLSSGVYFYTLAADNIRMTKTMVLVR